MTCSQTNLSETDKEAFYKRCTGKVHLIVKPVGAFQKFYISSSEQVVTVTQHLVIPRSHGDLPQPVVNETPRQLSSLNIC